MYVAPQNGQTTVAAVAPTLHLGTYRRAIMAAMADEVFTPAERLRANHSVYECQDGARLALWLRNVTRVRDEREAHSVALFAAALERGRELVAGPQPATDWQRNCLKMAAWELAFPDPAQRDELLTAIVSRPMSKQQAEALLARLDEALALQRQAATPAQCDEVFRLAMQPCILACEKSQALTALHSLTYLGAVRLLGQLYGKVLHRTGQQVGSDGSTQLAE